MLLFIAFQLALLSCQWHWDWAFGIWVARRLGYYPIFSLSFSFRCVAWACCMFAMQVLPKYYFRSIFTPLEHQKLPQWMILNEWIFDFLTGKSNNLSPIDFRDIWIFFSGCFWLNKQTQPHIERLYRYPKSFWNKTTT